MSFRAAFSSVMGDASGESRPLMKKEKDGGLRFWWNSMATHQYKFAVTYSSRVAAMTVLMSVIPLSFSYGRKVFNEYGFNVAYIVCNFLFTIGPDVGATVQNSIYGLSGNFWASLMLYVLNGFFPGGYTGENDTAFWVGLTCSMLFTLFFMSFNVNANVQFFALYGYIPYAMIFLNPTQEGGVSKAFTLDYKGTAVNALILYAVGAVFAILCAMLPLPVTSRAHMLKQVGDALNETLALYHQILEYYFGSTSNMQIYELISNVKGIRARLDAAKASQVTAWFECFGIGSHAKSRLMMSQIIASIEDILMHIDPLLAVVSREGFENTHLQITNELRAEMLSSVDKAEKLFKFVLQTTSDGNLSPNERAIMEHDVTELETSLELLENKLGRAGSAVSQSLVSTDTTGENYFIHCNKTITSHIIKRANGLLAEDHPRDSVVWAIVNDVKDVFDPGVILSKDHFNWVFRNTLSLMLCFWLGYFGWSPGCDKKGRSCFIQPYNASMATLVIVLLSKFVGSTFKNALDRLTAVVLANVIGQLGYVLVGWCTPGGRFMTAIMVFLLVMPGMYVAFSGGSYASLGMRLAAISAMTMLAPCSDKYITANQYAREYHAISDIVIGASIMLAVDMIFGGLPASSLAKNTLVEAIELYKNALNDFTGGKTTAKSLLGRLPGVKAKLDAAASLSSDAAAEPSFWRHPWRPTLFTTITTGFSQLVTLVHHLVQLILHEKAEAKEVKQLLENLSSYSNLLTEVDSSSGFTVDLSAYILHLDYPEEQVGLDKMLKTSEDQCLPLEELVKEVNRKHSSISDPSLTLRLSSVVETFRSLMVQNRRIQHQSILNKSS